MFTNEDDIDSALNAALDVRPSSGFEAAVHRRIEADRSAPVRGALPYWLAAAAAVVVIAGAWFALREEAIVQPEPQLVDRTPPAQSAPSVAANDSREPRVEETPAVQTPAARARAPRPAPSPAVQAARRAQPEVIVPPNQMELIEQLMRDLHSGRVELSEQTATIAAPPAELVVAPVMVEEISLPMVDLTAPAPSTSKGLY